MREIKFRAWDKELKEYLPNVQNHIGNSETAFGNMLKNDRYVIEQYTGLKDKDGKEIYEGDRIEITFDFDRQQGYEMICGRHIGNVKIWPSTGAVITNVTTYDESDSTEIIISKNCYKNIRSYRSKVIGTIHDENKKGE